MSDDDELPLFELSSPGPSVPLPSPQEIEQARTPAGGWSRQQLSRWGVAWPPPNGWRSELERRYAIEHPD